MENATGLADFPSRAGFQGKILVPFPIESSLSGVVKEVGSHQRLVYRRFLKAPASPSPGGGRRILHFGAVDWKAWVYVNGALAGVHQGGYDAFHFLGMMSTLVAARMPASPSN